MAPKPMPHPNDDPDHIAARASKQTFTEKAKAIRENSFFSDRYKAQQVHGLYETHVKETTEAYERIGERRRDRLTHLESLVPIGPGIPAGTSPADKAVLMTAFRTALDTAKDGPWQGRAALLAEAERFDDDAMRRAVLTFALDHGELPIVRDWTAVHLDKKDYLDEVRALRETLAGSGTGHLWDAQDFRPLAKPQEAYDWPRIESDPNARPGDGGREVRPGVIEYDRS